MTFALINPAWKSAVQKKAEQHAPAVKAWLEANPEERLVSLTELRSGLPAIAGDLSRAVVNQIAVILGAKVEGADDPAV